MKILDPYTLADRKLQQCTRKMMNSKQFFGKDVLEDRGWKIGKVRDVIIDTNSWQVKAFDVALEKHVAEEYGMKKTFGTATVPVRVDDVKSIGDAIMLKGSKLSLSTMPELGPLTEDKSKVPTTEKIKEKL